MNSKERRKQRRKIEQQYAVREEQRCANNGIGGTGVRKETVKLKEAQGQLKL
jgi:hypothetical protein